MKYLQILAFGCTIAITAVMTNYFNKPEKPFTVVSVDNLDKYVYRGVENPITVYVPNAKSVNVSAAGVKKEDDSGHYTFIPGAGRKAVLKINAILQDGSEFKDSVTLTIDRIPSSTRYFAGINCSYPEVPKLTIETLDAGKLAIERDFRYKEEITIRSFTVKIPEMDFVEMRSDSLSDEFIAVLKKRKKGTQIIISNIKIKSTLNFSAIIDDKPAPSVLELK